ncbi:MAG: Fe-S-binding domain-containing protein, partial [Gemmatimonadota bacterium]
MGELLGSIGYGGWVLSALVWLPVLGAGLVLLGSDEAAKGRAFGVALLTFLVSVPLWSAFDAGSAEFQFVYWAPWIRAWGIEYHLGVDGISLLLVLLTTLLAPITILGAYRYIQERQKTFYAMILVLQTGVV